MKFRFSRAGLEDLYKAGGKGQSKFSPETLIQFMKVMQIIRTANDERDLRAFKGRRLEKLQGNLEGYYSMRLTDQFRLIFSLQNEEVLIDRIDDYH